MNRHFPDYMRSATRLTRAGRLTEASQLLHRLFRDQQPDVADRAGKPAGSPRGVVPERPAATNSAARNGRTGPMRDALRGLFDEITQWEPAQRASGTPHDRHARAVDVLPPGAEFAARTYTGPSGSRDYKLYIPSTYTGAPVPLLIMLHGCTQSPDDFAAGTRMNALCEERACLVAYPGQTRSANPQKCWNWFSPADQQRDQGEPALIAGITRQVMQDYAVDPARVYVAGLSAGGAAAAIMAQAYPDLYAAVGIHSGLACGVARDIPSALAAMRHGAAAPPNSGVTNRGRIVPTIVFHADQDGTVHHRNGDEIIIQSAAGRGLRTEVQAGKVPGGHGYSRTLHLDPAGRTVFEQWLVHGGGHAWSGGSPAGTYTDPHGPNASREMLRFFLSHRKDGPCNA